MGRKITLQYLPGATPLDPDETEGLLPNHIMTQSQLNEWEQMNILDAEKWLTRHTFKITEILSTDFVKKVHKKMFNKTWSWAGLFRKSNKNIGVDWLTISVALKNLLDDARYQIDHTVYPKDELAARFHHRLVAIHPFANGNGRHARMMTDILLLSLQEKRFSWGNYAKLTEVSIIRQQYIKSLQQADKGDYRLLFQFIRS
jgi:Fic-DOC domain mobile mystery protein B